MIEEVELIGGPNDGELYGVPEVLGRGVPPDIEVGHYFLSIVEVLQQGEPEPMHVAVYRATVISDVTHRWRFIFGGWKS